MSLSHGTPARHDAGASDANAGDQGVAGTGQKSPRGDAAQQHLRGVFSGWHGYMIHDMSI